MINNNWNVWGFSAFIVLSLWSCSDNSSFNDVDYGLDLNNCTTNTQNKFVHRALQDRYYWYQEIPDVVDYSSYSSPQKTLEALRYSQYDRFSYVADASSFDSYYNEGEYIGFGFSYNASNGFIRYTFANSPAAQQGFKRGDKIVSIDGISLTTLIANNWNNAFGEASVGVSKTFVIEHSDKSQQTLTLSKAVVTIQTVVANKIIESNGIKYGYITFNNFINPALAELEAAFSEFKTQNVDKLILDLRYNGGGSISVATQLGSYIHTPQISNAEIFTQLRFNDKYQNENYSFYFKNQSSGLDVNEIIILSSNRTCSASEMIINGLKPFVDKVTVIGDTTCGKPIGMRSQNFCDKKLLAINFAGFNQDNEGEYFDGIPATCSASDDETYALGDINEPLLKEALYYEQNASCSNSTTKRMPTSDITYRGLNDEIGAE